MSTILDTLCDTQNIRKIAGLTELGLTVGKRRHKTLKYNYFIRLKMVIIQNTLCLSLFRHSFCNSFSPYFVYKMNVDLISMNPALVDINKMSNSELL